MLNEFSYIITLTSTADVDYNPTVSILVFDSNTDEVYVNVDITEDVVWEDDETFTGKLVHLTSTADADYTISPSITNATILDNDGK